MRSVQKVLKSLAWITRRLGGPLRSGRTTIVLTVKSKERLIQFMGPLKYPRLMGSWKDLGSQAH